MNVLVVDDSTMILELAKVALGTVGGHSVTTAESGFQALDHAAAARPDAILLDVDMPGIDGPETFSRLQADPGTASIPVILVTAKDDVESLASLGVAGVIGKPFDVGSLAGDVARIAGWAA